MYALFNLQIGLSNKGYVCVRGITQERQKEEEGFANTVLLEKEEGKKEDGRGIK